jgi:hypothetical protein
LGERRIFLAYRRTPQHDTAVVERAAAERPGHDTIEPIIEWLGLHQLRGLDLPHELFTPLVV